MGNFYGTLVLKPLDPPETVALRSFAAALALRDACVALTGLLAAAGACQSTSMLALSMLLLRSSDQRFRGRIMGVRMLAIYTLPLGLLADASFDNIHIRAGNGSAAATYSNIVISATSPTRCGSRADQTITRARHSAA